MTFSVRGVPIEATWGAIVPALLVLIFSVEQFGALSGASGGFLLLVCMLLHEGGHVAVAQASGTSVSAVGFCLKGTYIRRKAAATPGREVAIASAGPLTNAILALLLWNRPGVWHWLALMNAVLALSNVAPVPGSDGKRIMNNLVEMHGRRRRARTVPASAAPAVVPVAEPGSSDAARDSRERA